VCAWTERAHVRACAVISRGPARHMPGHRERGGEKAPGRAGARAAVGDPPATVPDSDTAEIEESRRGYRGGARETLHRSLRRCELLDDA